MALTAAVFGSSGLIGKALISELEENRAFQKIYCYSRKSPTTLGKKSEYRPFETTHFELKPPIDIVFCALGTTIKKAGSQAAFEEVDWHAVTRIAREAKKKAIPQLTIVSSMGANINSRNFYLRTKGQMEKAVKDSGPKNILIVRPSLLLGTRAETRIGENIGKKVFKFLAPLMKGPLLNYRPIEAVQVAKVMIEGSLGTSSGIRTLENRDLHS